MRIFLIDFENVHSEGMNGVDHLSDTDEVVIFYSSNADSISFDILHKLMFCKSKLSYYRIKRGGKNALDFQLSCYLGFRIHKDPDAEFYIISKDSGYDFIMDFWECGYLLNEPKIRRFNTIKTLLQWVDAQKKQKDKAIKAVEILADGASRTPHPTKKPTDVGDNVLGVPLEINLQDDETAKDLLSAAKTSHELYISMVKKFGQKKGREIYRNYKGEFKK